MKVSFDFDSTLERKDIQEYAKTLVKRGVDVWIVTSRYSDEMIKKKFKGKAQYSLLSNRDLINAARYVGIPMTNIKFMNFSEKYTFIKDMDFIFHLDDDPFELEQVQAYTDTIPVDSWQENWRRDCENALEHVIKSLHKSLRKKTK